MDTEKTNQRFSVSDVHGHIERRLSYQKERKTTCPTANVDPEPHQKDEDIKDEAFFF
jgi:hypothetical protein